VTDAEKTHFSDRIERLVKHFDGVHKVEATATMEGAGMKVEMVVHAVKGVTLAAAGTGPSTMAAFDEVLDRMDRQIKKLKERLKDRRS